MSYTEFYCDASTGDNTNGGSDAGSPSMSDTAGTGSWNSVTKVYTSVATTGSVAVGQFLSIYSGAATEAAYTARITAVSGGSGSVWVITVSATAYSGTIPTTGSTFKAKCGGTWKGPNTVASFPFGYITASLKNASSYVPRVNFKSGTTYTIRSTMNSNKPGPIIFQGYTTTVGDGGKATIVADYVSPFTTYVLLETSSGNNCDYIDFIFTVGLDSGTSNGINASDVLLRFIRVVISLSGGNGFYSNAIGTIYIECEAYSNNQGSGANTGGFRNDQAAIYIRCISHNNINTSAGFYMAAQATYVNCIADTNTNSGWYSATYSIAVSLCNCTSYGNTGSGLYSSADGVYYIENSIFETNSAYGINVANTDTRIIVVNCGFYSNTSGQTNGGNIQATGTITFTASSMTDPANGNFKLNSTVSAGAAARGAGRGNFTQNAGSYSSTTIGYPDVGAAQHLEAAAVSSTVMICN